MARTSQQKGKRAEFFVFGELIKGRADVYLPIIDTGIDAIVRREDGTHLDIQVKSTEASKQAGCFNVWDLEWYEGKGLFIVCVEMSKATPEIWILPSEVFRKHANVSKSKEGWYKYTLDIDAKDTKHGNETRRKLLKDYEGAWELLTE